MPYADERSEGKEGMILNMKNKILIIAVTLFFVIGMIILSIYLNNVNNLGISNKEESGMEIMKITSANFDEEVLNSDKTVLIDFYADWCGPCKAYSPIVEAVANENEDIKVVKINIDDAQDIAYKYQVMSIPTTVIIKNGQEVNRAVGMMSKSDLIEMVK